ncbi:TPA: hypothetical protein EYN98_00030 [Candidatus Poribacteria bacterium]|jgi:hypothetical protein|nr:hypothetical protein [Candidatus Poribacteria bacterium]HIA64469.1 hypothetical protein [Candidatus Poribacteria bacterium]HIB86216.1 hypothetical protein [Candidatus Poribacteria bacterium]
MVQRLVVVLLVVGFLIGLVCDGNAKIEVVVGSATELKVIKAEKITWNKDDTKMVRIPEQFEIIPSRVIAATYDEFGDLVSPKIVIPEKKGKVLFESY